MTADDDNLSTRHQRPGDAARPQDTLDREDERGRRASFDPKTGRVAGSGSGAGGGNLGEDYDEDPQAGGGAEEGKPR
ncbi:hypothetical protein IC614_11395 [Allosphingosinicella flava]|uniref:Uncharacterized protein n=1 Tax=Allosphingosinicella flava TaxID=2771430 RepID=A0A7T2GJB8_9SPHN|nr:hypothetical protein [Sphingosinicella flava]QPQ54905.1 hypothetical protein IC614_11395 [Sphingosinicella flava]